MDIVAEVVDDLCKKVVRKAKAHQRYLENREAEIARSKKRYQENKTAILNKSRERYRDDPVFREKRIADVKKRQNKDIEAHRASQRESSRKRWRNGKIKAYRQKRYRSDPKFRIARLMRGRINKAISAVKNAKKCASTVELVGLPCEEYMAYIATMFDDSMSWENHGKMQPGYWQIDHRMPLCSFDMTKDDEQRKGFHYTNCQPLWFKDHIKKGTKVPDTHEWRDGAWSHVPCFT